MGNGSPLHPLDVPGWSRRAFLLGVAGAVVAVDAMTTAWGANAATAVPTTQQPGWVSVRDHGAVGDGTHDDTAAFARAIAAAPKSNGVVFVPAGTYSVRTIYVTRSSIRITGTGTASVLRRRGGHKIDTRVIAVNSSGQYNTAAPGHFLTDVAVSNLKVDGHNSAVSSAVGSSTVVGSVFFGLVKRGTISGVTVVRPRESGVNLLGCSNCVVENTRVDGMIGDFQVNSINIAGDHFKGNPGWKVNQYPSSHITVRRCKVTGNWAKVGDSPAGGGFGICVQGSDHVSVLDTTVDLSGEPAKRGRNGGGIIFEGGGPAGALLLGHDYLARGNTVNYCHVGIGGVDTNAGDHTTGILRRYQIEDNTITNSDQGIQVNGSDVQVVGNTVTARSPLVIGANKISTESGYTIANNTFTSTHGACIAVMKMVAGGSVRSVVIELNTLNGAKATDSANGYGVVTLGAVDGIGISANSIVNTPGSGVYLYSIDPAVAPTNCVIDGNSLTNVCRVTTLAYPSFYGIVSGGGTGVVATANLISGGKGLRAGTASTKSPAMRISGNYTSTGAAAKDHGSVKVAASSVSAG